MKIAVLLLFAGISVVAQKNRKLPDVVSNIEGGAVLMKAVGNNTFAKDLGMYYGFNFTGNLMTPVRFGLGLSYTQLFSNVLAERRNIFGNTGSPTLTVIDLFLTHREYISEELLLEELAGFSYYAHSSTFIDRGSETLKNTGAGFTVGAKAVYLLDPLEYQALFLTAKANYFKTQVYNENSAIRTYYDHSYFLSISFGYRYNF